MKNADLYQLFCEYGNVEDAYIIKNRVTGKSKGFGYVVYET
jgi:RNA recognition motif-containing protein